MACDVISKEFAIYLVFSNVPNRCSSLCLHLEKISVLLFRDSDLYKANDLAMIDAYLYYSRKLLCRESNPGLKVKSRFMIDMIKIQSSQS